MKKKNNKYSIIVFIGILLYCFFLCGCNNTYQGIVAQSLTLTSCDEMFLEKSEKTVINEYLHSCYYENDNLAGFITGDFGSLSLYNALYCAKLADIMGDSAQLEIIKKHLNFLGKCKTEEFDVLNLVYFVGLCNLLDYPYDYTSISVRFHEFYDEKTGLFFLNSEDDQLSLKIAFTSLVIDNCSELLSAYIPTIIRSASELLDSYAFSMDGSNTFYNAGGCILYLCTELGLDISYKKTELSAWFDYWEKKYENSDKMSLSDFLSYIEYYKVASKLVDEYRQDKIYNFYNSISKEQINEISDMQMLYNIYKCVEAPENSEVNELMAKKNDYIVSCGLYAEKIDLKTSAFCVGLAKWSGFEYDAEKINNLIENEYEYWDEEASEYEKAEKMYYLIALDQLVNPMFEYHYSEEKIQEIIDDILAGIEKSDESIIRKIEITRMVSEIVADVQIFRADVKLSKKQVRIIKKVISQGMKNDEIRESVSIVSLAVVNNILGLSMIDEELILEAFDKLKDENGIKQYVTDEYEADIYATYLFQKIFELYYSDNEINEISQYKGKFATSTGLYSYRNGDEYGYDAASIYFGFYINNKTQAEPIIK